MDDDVAHIGLHAYPRLVGGGARALRHDGEHGAQTQRGEEGVFFMIRSFFEMKDMKADESSGQ